MLLHPAFKLGLRMVQTKLGQAMGDPSFGASAEQPVQQEKPMRDRAAKIIPPRIINPG